MHAVQPEHGRIDLDSVLRALSYYAIPICIAVLSLVALFLWDANLSASGSQPIEFRALSQADATLQPAEARTQLADKPATSNYDTRLSEAPVWFRFTVPNPPANMVEFPSRHAQSLACWDGADLRPLGQGTRLHTEGALRQVKAGFALQLEAHQTELLCRAKFEGPARLSAVSWPADQLDISNQDYHRKSGLLDGGLIVLAVFVLMMAVVNRQARYVLFAAWLILNLRVGELSEGWDVQWLGQTLPTDWLLLMRAVTIALYALLTITLYQTLFREDLADSGYATPIKALQWLCLPLLAASALLPFKAFLPFMWVLVSLGLLVMGASLVGIMFQVRSRVSLLYGASLGVMLLSSQSEILGAALGLKELVHVINSVTAALASSLLVALAIAEQMRLEHVQMIEAQAELEHAYEATPTGLFTLNLMGGFLSANPAMRTLLGIEIGKSLHDHTWFQHFGEEAWRHLRHMIHNETSGELEIHGKDGAEGAPARRFLVKATQARRKIEGSLQDITEKARVTENLRFMANNDPLTKVFNRRGIEQIYDVATNPLDASSRGAPMALAYLDLDRFKLINDLFGHTAGDEVLKQVCQRISAMLAAGQQLGRVGGDEFVIVMPRTSIALAAATCRAIVDNIGATPYVVGGKAFHVRCSIGLIEISPGTQIKDAVSAADRACREAKARHSESLVVYEKNSSALREREAELSLVERLSIDGGVDALFLEMQPIMSLKAPHAALNFEVLLRMRDKDGSVISAGRIIAAAENSGRIDVIDRWVLSTTLTWIEQHREKLNRTQFICMNLSGASLNDERFVQDTLDLLAQYKHAASLLCLEVTEGVALHDLVNTRRFIDKVRDCGVKVALDDFGAGYTSFSYLGELPADVLKIDGSFIVNMNAKPANVAIVAAIVNLATNFGMKTIAEWAEDNATVQTLAELGVDYVQGYAVARPQSSASMLSARSSASFIRDEELMRLTELMGATENAVSQIELFDAAKLH